MRFVRFVVSIVLFSACVLLHATSTTAATPLNPGSSVVPLSGSYSGTQLAAAVFNTSFVGVTETVFADAGNPLCPNCLDFVILVDNQNSTSSAIFVQSVSTEDFSGAQTDVAYFSQSPDIPPPFLASRTPDGTEITFYLAIPPGTSGDLLIIYTNAAAFGPGNIDVGTSLRTIDPPAYAPTSTATPEPSSFILLSTGLLGLAHRLKSPS